MEFQILHAFPIQSQPRLDVRIFGVPSCGIRITRLNFSGTFAIDFRQHWPKRNAKYRALCSAPTTLVGQRFSKFEDFVGKFHLLSAKQPPRCCSRLGVSRRTPTNTTRQSLGYIASTISR